MRRGKRLNTLRLKSESKYIKNNIENFSDLISADPLLFGAIGANSGDAVKQVINEIIDYNLMKNRSNLQK